MIYVERQAQENDPKNNPADNENPINLIVFLREPFAARVKPCPTWPLFQLIQAHSSLHHHGLIDLFRGARRRISLQAHLDLAKPEYLPRLKDALGDFLSVDKGS